jgi:hypothetical protein
MESRYGHAIARIRQEVLAVSLSPELATELHAEVGAPALRITRRYYDAAGEVFEITSSVRLASRWSSVDPGNEQMHHRWSSGAQPMSLAAVAQSDATKVGERLN